MNSKRSYLESLNAGRQRRQYASLDDLNRTLERGLETATPPETATPYEEDHGDIAERMERLSRAISGFVREADERAEQARRGHHVSGAAGDAEDAARATSGGADPNRIAADIAALRKDLHQQMTAGLRQEFDTLRAEIVDAFKVSPTAQGKELATEIEKLFHAVNELSRKSGELGVDDLRQEIGHVREALDTLAREETVHSVGRDFDHRFDAVEDHLSGASTDQAIKALADRLEQINDAVNKLPQSLSLQSMEEKLRTLAKAVERFLRQRDHNSPATFAAIEERLDEISRAIVASNALYQPSAGNTEPIERIEARISSLSRQLEELIEAQPIGAVMDQLRMISERIDDVAERVAVPRETIDNLERQIAFIAERLDRGIADADAGGLLEGMEQRFVALSQSLDRRAADAHEDSVAFLKELERRLEEHNKQSRADGKALAEALDSRIDELSGKLAGIAQAVPDAGAIKNLVSRLDHISSRIETAASQIEEIDPGSAQKLETQFAALADAVAKSGDRSPDVGDLGARLGRMEEAFQKNREGILEAARRAVADAVGQAAPSGDLEAIAGLATDLQSLEKLALKSDERSARTFAAIHDTLLQVVDKLGALDSRTAAASPEKQAAQMLTDIPSIDPGDAELLPASEGEGDVRKKRRGKLRMPLAKAAARAAAASDPEVSDPEASISPTPEAPAKPARSRSVLRGLTGALRSKSQPVAKESREEPEIAEAIEELAGDLEAPLDPKLANRPLEPGSGAPDINAIMKRVRDERGIGSKIPETEAAKSDFIAAARRAAQAAASEAELLKRKSDTKDSAGRFSLKHLLRANSKTIVLTAGAILIALAALQLGKAFMHEDHGAEVATKIAPPTHKAVSPVAANGVKTAKSSAPIKVGTLKPLSPLLSTDVAKASAAPAAAQPAQVPEKVGAVPANGTAAVEKPSDAAAEKTAAQKPAAMSPSAPASPQPTAAAAPAVVSASAPAAAAAKPLEPALVVPSAIGPASLRQAADAGNPKAMFEIGNRYAEGEGVAVDMKTAAQWYEKAASLGLAPAEYRIGNFYEKGTGVARDIAKAKDWYLKAADAGNASAMHNLAVLYAMGADGKTDNQAAARWFSAAAELGVKDSQFNLGILSAKGVGVPQNLEESYKWFALVAKTGDSDAAAKRDEVAKALRPDQLAKAKQMVELWKAKPADPAANVVDIPGNWKDDTTAGIDMKKAVRNIQLILDKNGYDAGTADGVMGDKTKAAIAKFQKDNGMKPTGEVDEKLVHALLANK